MKISVKQQDELLELVKRRGVNADEYIATIMNKGYTKLSEIEQKDYNYFITYFSKSGRD